MVAISARHGRSNARGCARAEHTPGYQHVDVVLRKHRAGRQYAAELIERLAHLTRVITVIGGSVEVRKAHERAMANESPLHLRDHGGNPITREAVELVVGPSPDF